jgi:hypothetical protein
MYLSMLMFEISVKSTRDTYELCAVAYPEVSTIYNTSATGKVLGRDPFSYNDKISFIIVFTSHCFFSKSIVTRFCMHFCMQLAKVICRQIYVYNPYRVKEKLPTSPSRRM